MPISSNADFIPTIDDFLAHWAVVNADQVLTVPVANTAVTLADLTALRGALDGAKAVLGGRLNTLEIKRVMLNQVRVEANARVAEFNRRVRAHFPDSFYSKRLPKVPPVAAGRGVFLEAMDAILDLWLPINALAPTGAFAPPLLLRGGLTLAAFQALRTALDGAFTARGTAEMGAALGRAERDTLQKRAVAILSGYRAMVEAVYLPDSTLAALLPRLYPLPGHTPDPVAVSATWNATEAKAEIAWEASAEETLKDYQLRAVPGPDYSGEDATVVHTFQPAEPRAFLTGSGFAIPGAAMSYKIFVRLTTGNERGSEAVTVTRPG